MIALKEISKAEKEINNIVLAILEADREVTKYMRLEYKAFDEGNREAELKFKDKINELDKTIHRRRLEIYNVLILLREKS